jgi:hypothetical protein
MNIPFWRVSVFAWKEKTANMLDDAQKGLHVHWQKSFLENPSCGEQYADSSVAL